MSCESDTATSLRDAGQKVTPQRMLILSAVRHRREHVTAGAVIDDVRRAYPFIDASTVYRTLSAARDLRLVSEAYMGGETQFEWIGNAEPHHHLICRICSSVSSLESSYVDGLASIILEQEGFTADLGHFSIFGVCRDCSVRGPTE